MEHYYALILGGGGGTRLWPLSRQEKPKQMLRLIDNTTMFQAAVRRLQPLFPVERIFVSTGHQYVAQMRADAPELPRENFIVEPSGRDSGPAVALALAHIHQRDPQATVAILTSDHFIRKEDTFRDVLEAAYHIAQEGKIVTLGIKPDTPATEFGYIERGAKLGTVAGFNYHVAARFTEKPDKVRASHFVASGRYSWNSGMFIWTTARALGEFKRQQPAWYALLQTLQAAIDTPNYEAVLNEIWLQFPKRSLDYAIMEGARDMVVIPTDIGWNDIGSWAALFDVLDKDGLGNVARGQSADDWIALDTHDTFVMSEKRIVTIGVEDLIVVETKDVLMICRKERSQDIKEVVNYLRENNQDDYL